MKYKPKQLQRYVLIFLILISPLLFGLLLPAVPDHGVLPGLGDDDHSHYFTDTSIGTRTTDYTTTGTITSGGLLVDTPTLAVNLSGYTNKVGIGTVTPAYKLDVTGDIRSTATVIGLCLQGVNVYAGNGTTALPSWSFITDSNTGVWRSTTDTLNISTAGTERFEIDATSCDITVPLNVAPDTDISAQIGRAHIGYDGALSDFVIFSHVDRDGGTDYALRQSASGTTYLNTATGQTVQLRIANAEYVRLGVNYLDLRGSTVLKQAGTQVVGAQQAHIADADAAVAAAAGDPPTEAEFNALVTAYNDLATKFNTLLSKLDADAGHGLLAGAP